MCLCVSVCVHIFVSESMCVCMCVSVCQYVCMSVPVYACLCVSVCMCDNVYHSGHPRAHFIKVEVKKKLVWVFFINYSSFLNQNKR